MGIRIAARWGHSQRGWDLVIQPPRPGSHLSSPVSSCPAAFPRCGDRSATAACVQRAPDPSGSACARAWASTVGLTRSPVSAPGCSHQTTAALGTGQRTTVTPGQAQRPTPRRGRGGAGQGGWPGTLFTKETGEGWHWTVTQKLFSVSTVFHSQGTIPPNCQQTVLYKSLHPPSWRIT